LRLRVYPGASSNRVTGFADRVLQVRIAAPPAKGKANVELIRFLCKMLGVSKSSLTIVKGFTSRNKVIAVAGLGEKDIIDRLSPEQNT